jgi:L-ascorbate metabolism protein UlaG (beta-lactamase superfamily)
LSSLKPESLMSIQLQWLGHNCWLLKTGSHQLLIDPFLDDSPVATLKSHDVSPDFILVSHAHFDHVADVVPIAERTHATVIGMVELCHVLATKHGVKHTVGMNVGGSFKAPFGQVKLTIAHHSSSFADGTYAGPPVGFLLTIETRKLYFACDTALFYDMSLIGAGGLDVAVVPIGDHYTMGPTDSIEAIKLLEPRRAVPAHYNTWPPIAQDAAQWAELVRQHTKAEPIVLDVGQSIEV